MALKGNILNFKEGDIGQWNSKHSRLKGVYYAKNCRRLPFRNGNLLIQIIKIIVLHLSQEA